MCVVTSGAVASPDFSGLPGYTSFRQLHIRSGSSTADLASETVPAGYAVCLSHVKISVPALIASARLRDDLKDLRIVYAPLGSQAREIPCEIRDVGSGNRDIWFNLQKPFPACSTDSDYYLCYGNSGENTSPVAGFAPNELLNEDFSSFHLGTFAGGGENAWTLDVEPSGGEDRFEVVSEGASPPALQISRSMRNGEIAVGVTGISCKPIAIKPGAKLNVSFSMRIVKMEKDPAIEQARRARQVLSGTWLGRDGQPVSGDSSFEIARIQDSYQSFQAESRQVIAPDNANSLRLSYYICHCAGTVLVDNIVVQDAGIGVSVAPVVDVFESAFKPKFEKRLPDAAFRLDNRTAILLPPDYRKRYRGHFDGQSLVVTKFLEEAMAGTGNAKPEAFASSGIAPRGNAIWIGEISGFPALKSRLNELFPDRPAIPAQGYYLVITKEQILVVGADPAGTFYGCLELAARVNENRLDATLVADWPEQKFRAAQFAAFDRSLVNAPVKEFIKKAAHSRLNAVTLESYSDYYYLDDAKIRNGLLDHFDTARAYFLEPIPSSFQFRNQLPVCDYNCYAGKWVENEPYVLAGAAPVEFKRKADQSTTLGWWGGKIAEPNAEGLYPTLILRTKTAKVVVRSADGKRTFREGGDYTIAGGFAHEKLVPFTITRAVKSSIKDGETVLVSYNYLYRPRTDSYSTCLSEPIAREKTREAIRKTISLLKPKYIHINCDEIVGINRDSRDLERKMTGAEIFADFVNYLYRCAKQADRRVQVLLYDDMLNKARGEEAWWANHNAPHYPQGAIDLIPKDIIMCVWNYGTDKRQLKAWSDYMFAKGFAVVGTPADYSEASPLAWAEVLKEAKVEGKNVFGSYMTEWAYHDDLNLSMFGASAWGLPIRVLGESE